MANKNKKKYLKTGGKSEAAVGPKFKGRKTEKTRQEDVRRKIKKRQGLPNRSDDKYKEFFNFSQIPKMTLKARSNELEQSKLETSESVNESLNVMDDSQEILIVSSSSEDVSDVSDVEEKDGDPTVEGNVAVLCEKLVENGMQSKDAQYISVKDSPDVHALVVLKESVEVAVTGKFGLKVIKGYVDVLGYRIKEQINSIPVFSSKYTGVLQLSEAGGDKTSKLSDDCKEYIRELFRENADDVIEAVDASSSAAFITKLTSGVSLAANIKPHQHIFPETPKLHYKDTELVAPIETRHWNEALDHIIQEPANFITVLCGNKNTGKSTFARFLTNSILSNFDTVYFLECDVGQTEFTAPGIISLSQINAPLLGPPFMHLTKPIVSFSFGNITPRVDPKLYLRCINEAFQYYQHNCSTKEPLIINTQGWMKGIGLSLLIDIIRLSKPTMVLQFKTSLEIARNSLSLSNDLYETQPGCAHDQARSPGDSNVCDNTSIQDTSSVETDFNESHVGFDVQPATSFLTLPAYEGGKTNGPHLKAVDYRRLALLSYFDQMFVDKGRSDLSQNCGIEYPLQYFVPRILYWKDVAVHVMHCKVPPSLILHSLNFSLVSLATVHPNLIINLPGDMLPDGPKFLRENPVALHLGFGFIRNIDVSRKAFLILTPEPEERLARVNSLLKGAVDMPMGIFNQSAVMPNAYATVEEQFIIRGSSARKPRFNLKRKKFDSPARSTK